MSDYDSSKRLNWSSLKHLHTSPLLYRWRIDHPEPPKPQFVIGSAIHCRVLEPEEFDNRYALCPVKRDKRHNAYQEWLAEHLGREPLNADEMETAKAAGDAVLAHPVAARILKNCRHEEPLMWTDPDTGLECKGRVDAISPEYIVDLKSDRDPSPRKFNRHAAEMLYHGQLAMYQTGAMALRKIDGATTPYIIAVAKDPPYDVAVYQMKPEDLAAGRALVVSLMRKLEECIAADWWPGCAPDLQYLDLPPWTPGLSTGDESEDF